MAKKSKSATATATATDLPTTSSLKTVISDHSLFFDNLVTLIPPRFYLSSPDANPDEEKPWFQGLSKAAKASAKKQSRLNLKKSRLQRFNPQTPSSTLDVIQEKSVNSSKNSDAPDQSSVTYEELRQRLHQRLQDLRSRRNTRPKMEPRNNNSGEKKKINDHEKNDNGDNKKKRKIEETSKDSDIEFGKVKVGDEDNNNNKKKMSKFKELEKAERLAELKKDPEKGEKVSWNLAEIRAMGVKVHDDPKILKESIRKEKRGKKKSAEKWKERVESREGMRREKQKTRSDNIKERILQKKMRRIEKREKKLMRPGFEGLKEGYINE